LRSSAVRHTWEHEPGHGRGAQRIVAFPARGARRGVWLDDELDDEAPAEHETEPLAEPVFRPRQRGSQAVNASDSIARYLVTAAALVLGVVAVAFLLLQLGQVGRQTPPTAKPTQAAQGPAEAAVPASPTGPPPGAGPLRETRRNLEPSYTVAPGDTLGSIAARAGTSVEALTSINSISDRNVLAVGQKLYLPNQP
jgi:LysM repeat protein